MTRKRFILARTACAAASLLGLAKEANAEAPVAVDVTKRESIHATLGFAPDPQGTGDSAMMVREVRSWTLPSGRVWIEWSQLARAISVDTLDTFLVNAPEGIRIVGRRTDDPTFTPAGVDAALKGRALVGTTAAHVNLRRQNASYGAHSAPQETRPLTGTVVTLAGGTVLRVDGELVALPASGPRFSARSDAPLPIPHFYVELQNDGAPRSVKLAVTYLSYGITEHQPRYKMQWDTTSGKARISGTTLIGNESGLDLDQATFSLTRGTEFRAFDTRRGKSALTELAETWGRAARPPRDEPFMLPGKGAFDSSGLSERTIVENAELTPSFSRSARISSLSTFSEQAERDRDMSLPALSVWRFDSASLKLASPLPSGSVRISEDRGATSGLLAEGILRTYGAKPTELTAQVAGEYVTGKQISFSKPANCTVTSVWRFEFPTKLTHQGPLEIVFPFDKKSLTATLVGKSGATLKTDGDQTTLLVPKATTAAANPDADSSVTVRLRTNPCL